MTAADHYRALAFARISSDLVRQPDHQHTLQRAVDLATETIPGCEFAGLTLREANGRVRTPAATSPLALAADEAQYAVDEGPCLDAIRVHDTCLVDDLTTESRWPAWTQQAGAIGVRSVLSIRLSDGGDVLGGLNLYSSHPAAYDDDALETARVYALHAATAMAATGELEGLRTAMQTRHLIGVAQGILMHRYAIDEERAFELLRRHSQNANVKLRAVAARVIRDRGDL